MSYSKYTGTILVRSGRGKDDPSCTVDISKEVAPNLSHFGLLKTLVDKYGDEVIANWAFAGFKEVARAAGKKVYRTLPNGISVIGATALAKTATLKRVKGDMKPIRRRAPMRVTSEVIRQRGADLGLDPKAVEKLIMSLST